MVGAEARRLGAGGREQDRCRACPHSKFIVVARHAWGHRLFRPP
jgi:hypothetical protein